MNINQQQDSEHFFFIFAGWHVLPLFFVWWFFWGVIFNEPWIESIKLKHQNIGKRADSICPDTVFNTAIFSRVKIESIKLVVSKKFPENFVEILKSLHSSPQRESHSTSTPSAFYVLTPIKRPRLVSQPPLTAPPPQRRRPKWKSVRETPSIKQPTDIPGGHWNSVWWRGEPTTDFFSIPAIINGDRGELSSPAGSEGCSFAFVPWVSNQSWNWSYLYCSHFENDILFIMCFFLVFYRAHDYVYISKNSKYRSIFLLNLCRFSFFFWFFSIPLPDATFNYHISSTEPKS